MDFHTIYTFYKDFVTIITKKRCNISKKKEHIIFGPPNGPLNNISTISHFMINVFYPPNWFIISCSWFFN
jgi:hypothetical protein